MPEEDELESLALEDDGSANYDNELEPTTDAPSEAEAQVEEEPEVDQYGYEVTYDADGNAIEYDADGNVITK